MWHDLVVLVGVSKTCIMVLVDGIGKLSTSIMGGCLYVASVDNCYVVVNCLYAFTYLSQYAICFESFRCLELISLQNFPGWGFSNLIMT